MIPKLLFPPVFLNPGGFTQHWLEPPIVSSHLRFCGALPAVFGGIFCLCSPLSESSTVQLMYLGLWLDYKTISGFSCVAKAAFPQRYRLGLNLTQLEWPCCPKWGCPCTWVSLYLNTCKRLS